MRKKPSKQDIPKHEMTDEIRRKLATEAFQALTIQDDFMFASVMKDQRICLKVLNILLKDYFKIGSIKLTTTEATIENHPELKFVRLDVLATDEAGNSYDIEMQVVNRKNIEKRMRAYQVAIDMFKMQVGMDYNALTNTIIIFLCPFDPFGEGLPFYFFEQHSFTFNRNVKMSDGTYKVVFNTSAYKDVVNEELRELLKFFQTGKATSAVAKEMEMKVSEMKKDSILFENFFSTFASLVDARNDGREEGWLQGREKGRVEGVRRGRKEGSYAKAVDTAKKSLQMGLPIEMIIELTGLTEDEILKLSFKNEI